MNQDTPWKANYVATVCWPPLPSPSSAAALIIYWCVQTQFKAQASSTDPIEVPGDGGMLLQRRGQHHLCVDVALVPVEHQARVLVAVLAVLLEKLTARVRQTEQLKLRVALLFVHLL